jgi:hypothetical protein
MKGLQTKAGHNFIMRSKKGWLFSMIVFLTVLFILASGCQNSAGKLPVLYAETDWERMGLHGKVNSLSLYNISWEESFSKINLKSENTIDQSTVFLNTGNQIESTYYNMNGLPNWKDVFIYASDGETWLECVSYKYINAGETVPSPQWSYTNSYGNDGRLFKVAGYNYDSAGQKLAGESWVHIYEYLDDEGKIAHSSYTSSGALQWKNISRYNADALETESTQYDNNGNMQWRDEFKYDVHGNKIEWSRYDSESSLQWKDVFKYDDKGNEIECANFDRSNKLLWKDIYLYLNESDFDNLDLNQKANFINRFDSNGNWTLKLTLEEKKGFGSSYFTVKEIEKRAITYFP